MSIYLLVGLAAFMPTYGKVKICCGTWFFLYVKSEEWDQTKWVETSGMVSFFCSVSLFGVYVKYAFWLIS
jgi:hypothetical protein